MAGSDSYKLDDLLYLMARLRDPEGGCPWDRAQDFATIVPHTLEESYELADAIERGDWNQVRDELGDVLFQVVFYAQLGAERSLFDFNEVVAAVVDKLLRRHPHVFPDGSLRGDRSGKAIATSEVKENWEAIKRAERRDKAQHSELDDVPLALPALSRAQKLQKRAARVGFDWSRPEPVLDKLREEIAELEQALAADDRSGLEEEAGDLLFAAVNLCRKLGFDAETSLRYASHKFERRFRSIETTLSAEGRSPADSSLTELEALWQQAKAEE